MALFLAAAAAAVAVIWEPALEAFMANPALNGVIVGVLVVGVFVCVRQAASLSGEIAWVEAFERRGPEGAAQQKSPRLLAPIARALGGEERRSRLAAASTQALLDGLGSRLDEGRELSRYLVGLLIFLGLLGTFWGLLETVRSVGNVVDGLSAGDAAATFDSLKSGLRAPLDGMGTAFSSSLFGLAGALALGFLDLQAGQAQNRFYNDVEDWLAGMSRLHAGPHIGDMEGGGGSASEYVEALLGQTAESLADLNRLVTRSEEMRRETQQALARTGDRLHDLGDRLEALGRIVESQQHSLSLLAEKEDIAGPALRDVAAKLDALAAGDPEAKRQRAQMERLLERIGDGVTNGQSELARELRSELRLIGRALSGRPDGSN